LGVADGNSVAALSRYFDAVVAAAAVTAGAPAPPYAHLLCADHFGAPSDLLAAALDVRLDRLRGIVARWRRAGYAETGILGRARHGAG
jgi:hypothetical protein